MRVLKENVLVRLAKAKKQSDGGIILPDKAVASVNSGVVVSVGDEVTGLSVGEEVCFTEHAPYAIDDEHVVISVSDILVVKEDK